MPVVIPVSSIEKLDDDLLVGADQIGEFVLGRPADPAARKKMRRRVYHLASEAPVEKRLPCFRIGGREIAARRSTLLAYVAALEREAIAALGLVVVDADKTVTQSVA
jgi:hypothetical protein